MRKTCIIMLALNSIHASRDVLLEFKGAYLLPTSTTFKNTYGNGSGLYGLEGTVQLYKNLYGWLSIDFLNKHSHTFRTGSSACIDISQGDQVIACDGYPTRTMFIPLAGGLKYFVPFANSNKSFTGDFYLGLGIEPTYLQTRNSAPYVLIHRQSKWGVGGIAKIGSYFDLPRNFLLDVFFDYSFVWVKHKKSRVNLDACIFGIGIGYRFN